MCDDLITDQPRRFTGCPAPPDCNKDYPHIHSADLNNRRSDESRRALSRRLPGLSILWIKYSITVIRQHELAVKLYQSWYLTQQLSLRNSMRTHFHRYTIDLVIRHNFQASCVMTSSKMNTAQVLGLIKYYLALEVIPRIYWFLKLISFAICRPVTMPGALPPVIDLNVISDYTWCM